MVGVRAEVLNAHQRRTLAELGAELRSIDAFGRAHVRAASGRLHKIDAMGRVWDYDRDSWHRPEWMFAR